MMLKYIENSSGTIFQYHFWTNFSKETPGCHDISMLVEQFVVDLQNYKSFNYYRNLSMRRRILYETEKGKDQSFKNLSLN